MGGKVMRRMGRVAVLAALFILLPASAAFGAASYWVIGTGTGSGRVKAGSISKPSQTPSSVHPNVTGSSDGNVKVSWTDTANPNSSMSYLVLRSSASPWTTFTALNLTTPIPGSGVACTVTSPGGVFTKTCSYTDATAAYNSTYVYEIEATGAASGTNWISSPTSTDSALSIPPSVATESYNSLPNFNAVSAASATSIWTVGANCTILHSNGTSWQTVPSPTGCTTGWTLNGVDGTTATLMVVGSTASGTGASFACTANCTGTGTPTWSSNLGLPAGYDVPLNAVAAASPTSMWAVGAQGTGTHNPCNVLYYNGSAWSSVSIPATGTGHCSNTALTGVSANGGHPVVVGAYDAATTTPTIYTCTTTGTGACTTTYTWTPNAVTGITGTPSFYGVASNGTNVWAVGSSKTVAVCTTSCSATTATWATQSAPSTLPSATNLRGISVQSSTAMLAVGDSGSIITCTTSCTSTGTAWSSQTSPVSVQLNGVGMPTSTTAWAAGNAGTLVALSSGTWTPQWSGLTGTASSYSLMTGDLTNLSTPGDTLVYQDQEPWPSTALPTTCSSGVLLHISPTIPPGTAYSVVDVTVSFRTNLVPGTGAGFQLLTSTDGSTWTAHGLTAPTAANTLATTSTSITGVTSSTTLTNLEACFQGTSGSGSPLTTSIDVVHTDLN